MGDQQAAVLGHRCVEGEAKNTYGTGCFMLMHTGDRVVPSAHGLLSTALFQLGPDATPQYALEGSVATAGCGVQWLRDKLGIISESSEVETKAESVPDTAGVYFVPALTGLYAPHWRADARGTVVGLTHYATDAHICRAMLEAICFQSNEVLESMVKDEKSEVCARPSPARLRARGTGCGRCRRWLTAATTHVRQSGWYRGAEAPAGGWGCMREQPADADPSRPAGRTGIPPRVRRDDCVGRGYRGGRGHWRVEPGA